MEWIMAMASAQGGNCVEVRHVLSGVQMRDHKLGESSPILQFTCAEWVAFLAGCCNGEFNLPELPRQATD